MRDNEYSRKSKLKSKRLAPANYLIVCEGKQTEPNYFNGLKKQINEKYGNKVDVFIQIKDMDKFGLYLIKMIIMMNNLILQ